MAVKEITMIILNTVQYDSLRKKIYDSLISNPDYGLGEMGECSDEAKRIVDEWMEENNIQVSTHLNF